MDDRVKIKEGVKPVDNVVQAQEEDSFLEDPKEENIASSSNTTGDEEAKRNISIGLRPLFRKIERLPMAQLTKKLDSLNLRSSGNRDILLKRLKRHYERKKQAQCNLLQKIDYPPYFIVIDFEATCIEVNPPDYPHEIIEFPAILVSSKTRTVQDTFREFVRPVINPRLSQFCVNLTGITQDTVDAADTFPAVLERFEKWLLKHGLRRKKMYRIVTDGPWDMAQFLHGQCLLSDVPYPAFADTWINLRKIFRRYYKCKTCHLRSMLGVLGLKFEGRPHCGRDDALNIAKVLINLIDDFAVLEVNETLDTAAQKHREKALLRSAIQTLEKRKDPANEELVQILTAALEQRSQQKRNCGYDDPELVGSTDEEESGDKEGNLRPKVTPVVVPVNNDSEEEDKVTRCDQNGGEEGYKESSFEDNFPLLKKKT